MAATQGIVTSSQLATYFGITVDRVGQLTREGMPKVGHGRHDFLIATRWYIRFLQESNRRRNEVGGRGGADPLKVQRAEALEIDTEIKRLTLSKVRGELVPLADVLRMFDDAVGTLKAKMMAGVTRAASRVIGVQTHKQAVAVVEEVVIAALAAMEKVKIDWRQNGDGGKYTR